MALCEEMTPGTRKTIPWSTFIKMSVEELRIRLVTYFETRKRLTERRDAFKTLLTLGPRELNDIGLDRDDIIAASKLPLRVNASEELQKLRIRKL